MKKLLAMMILGTALAVPAPAAMLTTEVSISYYGQNMCSDPTFNSFCGTTVSSVPMADTSQVCEPYSWAMLGEAFGGLLQWIANWFGFSVEVSCGWQG
jgi:hypothetical protein